LQHQAKSNESTTTTLAKSAGSVSIAVFLSRILGLVREQVLANLFGAGTAMDAFVVAFRIPNLLRDLFAEGALSSAFVTVFTEYHKKKGSKQAWLLANNVFTVLTILISLIVIIGIIFSDDLVKLMAPEYGLIPGKLELTTRLTIIMFPFLLLVSQAAFLMGILNVKGRFFIPAFASSCFNLASIVIGGGLALLLPKWSIEAIYGMAIGTLLGGAAQLFIQLPSAIKVGFHYRPRIDLSCPGLRKIGRLIIPAIIGLSATQINIFLNTNFASQCGEGSVAWLNYAFRLIMFPIGVFGVALSIATMPVAAKQATSKDLTDLSNTVLSSLTLVFALSIPAAVGLWILAEPIIKLIFEHGRFTNFDTIMTAQALRFYAIGLMAYSAVKVIVPVYYALDDTKWPVIGSFSAVAVNVIIILFTLDYLQHRSIALGTSISMIFNFFMLFFILYKKIDTFHLQRLIQSVIKIAIGSTIMAYLLYLALSKANQYALLTSTWNTVLFLTITIPTGAALFGISIYLLKVPEVTLLFDKLKQRIVK